MNKHTAKTIRTAIIMTGICFTSAFTAHEIAWSNSPVNSDPCFYSYNCEQMQSTLTQDEEVASQDFGNEGCKIIGPGWLYFFNTDGTLTKPEHITRECLTSQDPYIFSQVKLRKA